VPVTVTVQELGSRGYSGAARVVIISVLTKAQAFHYHILLQMLAHSLLVVRIQPGLDYEVR